MNLRNTPAPLGGWGWAPICHQQRVASFTGVQIGSASRQMMAPSLTWCSGLSYTSPEAGSFFFPQEIGSEQTGAGVEVAADRL